MLTIDHLTTCYKQQTIIQNLSLQVGANESIAMIGPSGSGKSTLLNCINGLHRTYQGEIQLNGFPLSNREHTISWIPQNYGLLPWKTVMQNILMSLKIKKQPVDMMQIKQLLEQLGIAQLVDQYPNQLSGGQRQRVAIARSFILQSDILLMDEPFSALDAFTREQSQHLFLRLWRQLPCPTIVITHDINEAFYLGQRIALLSTNSKGLTHVLDNPLFGLDGTMQRNHPSFDSLHQMVREALASEWSE